MGKSKTSPLSKTTSVIGVGGGGGGVISSVGSTSSAQASVLMQPTPPVQPANQNTNQPATPLTPQEALVQASQTPSPYGNDTSAKFATMTDSQMAQAVSNSINVDMPYHVSDAKNSTQEFMFANGLNAKPTVLSDADFDTYMKNNKIGTGELLIREVDPISVTIQGVKFKYTPSDLTDQFKSSDITYVGGKQGGHAYGYGSYFGMSGSSGWNYSSGYGSGKDGVGHKTIVAVFDKSKARAIYNSDISSEWTKFSATHKKTASAVNKLQGDVRSVKALLMGYNVITSESSGSLKGKRDEYYNILDRSALVVRASDRK